MKKFTLSIFYFIPILLYGQVQRLALSERIDEASTIVLATKINEKSYWDARHENIWTRHTFSIKSYFKNPSTAQNITAITPGGIVDGDMQVTCPSAEFEIQKDYVLLLEPENFSVQDIDFKNNNPEIQQCLVYSGIQGFLPFNNNFYYDLSSETTFTEQEAIQNITQQTKTLAVTPTGENYFARRIPFGIESVLSGTITTLTDGSGVTPATGFIAGTLPTQNELIISGNGFGSTTGSLLFANVDNNGSTNVSASGIDIISWTDTQIRTKIPRKGGSGTLQILSSGNSVLATSPITVRWAEINIKHIYYGFSTATLQQIELIGQNSKGGYTFQYSTNNVGGQAFSSQPNAQAAFTRAVNNWRDNICVNFDISNVSTDSGYKADGINTILYDSNLPAGGLAICTSRYKAIATADCQLSNTLWYVSEMDIQVAPYPFNSNYTWNYSTAAPAANQWDFESVLSHELGHGIGLDHINNPTTLMFWSLPNGIVRRTISSDEIEAGKYRLQHSSQTHCVTSPSSYIAIPCTNSSCKTGIWLNCTIVRN